MLLLPVPDDPFVIVIQFELFEDVQDAVALVEVSVTELV
jgi:hypothetical protein